MARRIVVVPYDPAWPAVFEAEAVRIVDLFGANAVKIHHIGSTAIPGLMAKPTIDLLFVVEDIEAVDALEPGMKAMGYRPKGENGIPGRRYFQKLAGEEHLFHVHAFEVGHPEIRRHLNFRDYLRAHPDVALAYQDLKLSLAEQFPYEPEAYNQGKTDFIRDVDQCAVSWKLASEQDANDV